MLGEENRRELLFILTITKHGGKSLLSDLFKIRMKHHHSFSFWFQNLYNFTMEKKIVSADRVVDIFSQSKDYLFIHRTNCRIKNSNRNNFTRRILDFLFTRRKEERRNNGKGENNDKKYPRGTLKKL